MSCLTLMATSVVGQIWVHPESPKTLGAAFGKLKVLHLMGVFPECDLSWTMFLLQAAPFLEFLNIQVYIDLHSFYI